MTTLISSKHFRYPEFLQHIRMKSRRLLILTLPNSSVRQGKPGASSGCNSRSGKGRASPPGTESWAHGGNDMG
jgi:hypothetical protein